MKATKPASGFKSQGQSRRHQKFKIEVKVTPQNGLMSSKKFKRKRNRLIEDQWNTINLVSVLNTAFCCWWATSSFKVR